MIQMIVIRFFRKIASVIRDMYHDRRLMFNLSWQDYKRRFAGAYFGVIWSFLTPLLTMLVYWLVFEFGFRSGSVEGVPFVLWFMCGIVAWLFISEAFTVASNSFLEYSYLVKKVVFNISILPMVKILSSLYIHCFFLAFISVICICFGFYPNIFWIQLPYYLLCATALVFSVSLFFSSIIVFFRDLGQVINIILLIGMWGTPIAWQLTMFPEQYHFFFKLNPVYYIVEGYRDSFLNGIWFWQKYNQTLYFWALITFLFFTGCFVFHRLKQSFADVL